jgi:hypothetical protein
MLANTKQVRSVLKGFNLRANYTEKTSKKLSPNTRVVMATLWGTDADALLATVKQKFTELGYTNKVYLTGDVYLRVKTLMV